jgi:hypothetical protein
MRKTEAINTLAFLLFLLLAWSRDLPRAKRVAVSISAASGLAAIAFAQWLDVIVPTLAASVIRDWLPGLLMLLMYWQSGAFFSRPNSRLQSALQHCDDKVADMLSRVGLQKLNFVVSTYLELSYLACYPLVPFGLAALYIMHKGRFADYFWATVLPPTYFCYVMVAFLPTLPPRLAGAVWLPPSSAVRSFNLWILDRGSIQVNTFPSAHVAASVATALALVPLAPIVGSLWLWIAVSIAVGSVVGRYHYILDSLAGIAVALFFVLIGWILRGGLHQILLLQGRVPLGN